MKNPELIINFPVTTKNSHVYPQDQFKRAVTCDYQRILSPTSAKTLEANPFGDMDLTTYNAKW